ncbi:MAG: excisionase [Actinomycetota bacterium]|nr:excisionase [Actinomycetota bacterium]
MDEWDEMLELANLEAGLRGDETWVTLAEAEGESGVSRSALRAWYRIGELPSRLVDGPHGPQRLVPLEAVVARARQSPRIQRKAARAVGFEAEVAALRERVAALERRIAALEDRRGGR